MTVQLWEVCASDEKYRRVKKNYYKCGGKRISYEKPQIYDQIIEWIYLDSVFVIIRRYNQQSEH